MYSRTMNSEVATMYSNLSPEKKKLVDERIFQLLAKQEARQDATSSADRRREGGETKCISTG